MPSFDRPPDSLPPPVPPAELARRAAASAADPDHASWDEPPVPAQYAGQPPAAILPRILVLLALLLALQYIVPYLLERYHYAITRGKQQAEYDVASQGLQDLQLAALSKASQMVSQKVGPSVVHIDVISARTQRTPNELAQLFGPQPERSRGQGSGVIVDPAGYIVTNFHVVQSAAEIRVSLRDGRLSPARVVGVDVLTDLAVLKISADNLIAAPWGDSESMHVGSLVWALGSPFGLQSSITFGIISAKHRGGMAGEVYQDFLQTDAAVNPGNSGGPLVDAQGRVIGINTAILGDAYRGVSFAIPSSVAQGVYERLKANGRVARGWLGVQLDDVSEQTAQRLGLPAARGALIVTVIDDPSLPSPAMEAGLMRGDVVVSWNGTAINKSADLIRLVAMTEIGSVAQVEVFRRGELLTVPVRVAERPAL